MAQKKAGMSRIILQFPIDVTKLRNSRRTDEINPVFFDGGGPASVPSCLMTLCGGETQTEESQPKTGVKIELNCTVRQI